MMKYHLIVQNSKFTAIAYIIKCKTKHMSALSLSNSTWECSGTLIIHMAVIITWALIIKVTGGTGFMGVTEFASPSKPRCLGTMKQKSQKWKNINEKIETFKKTYYPPSPPAYGNFVSVCSLFLSSFFNSVLENWKQSKIREKE